MYRVGAPLAIAGAHSSAQGRASCSTWCRRACGHAGSSGRYAALRNPLFIRLREIGSSGRYAALRNPPSIRDVKDRKWALLGDMYTPNKARRKELGKWPTRCRGTRAARLRAQRPG